jgi:general secretion pathway protein G
MSLVEVMVTIAIVLTLMSLVMLGVVRTWEQSRVGTTELTLGKVGQQVEIYRMRKGGRVPSNADGLAAVYAGEEVPLDAWQNPVQYVAPGPGGAPYALVSYGSDGADGGAGFGEDIVWSPR